MNTIQLMLSCYFNNITIYTGSIVANDVSKQRFTRLKKVVKQYLPKDSNLRIKLVNLDGKLWNEIETSSYNKVSLIFFNNI